MVELLQDIYWFFFGTTADEAKTDNATAGFLRWAETDYFAYPPKRRLHHTFKGGPRIAQPEE